MNTANLILYTLAAFGGWYVVGSAKISYNARRWLRARSTWLTDLIQCPACSGFWIGLLVGIVIDPITFALLLACYTCGANVVLGSITGLMPPEEK